MYKSVKREDVGAYIAVFDYLQRDLEASLFPRWECIEWLMCYSFLLLLSSFAWICISILFRIHWLSIWLRTVSCNLALCIFPGGGDGSSSTHTNTHSHIGKCALIICTLQIYNTAIVRLSRGRDPGRTQPACLTICKVRSSHLYGLI